MTQSRFFQISLSLPFALWAVGLLIISVTLGQDSGSIGQNLYNGHHIFLPYLVFAAVVWKLASNKTYGLLMFMAFVVPILWGCFFTLWYVAATYILTGNIETWFVLSIMAFWATLVGFLCEAIPFWVLSKFKAKFKAVQQTSDSVDAMSPNCS